MSNIDNFLAHYGVKGMKWGVTKSDYRSMSKDDRKQYRKKTLKERSKTFKEAREKNVKFVAETAAKNGNEVFVKTRLAGDQYPTLMSGSEFTRYISKQGVFDANMTAIAGYANTPKGLAAQKFVDSKLDDIWAPTAERYVRKDG